jgi:hypothetical protein
VALGSDLKKQQNTPEEVEELLNGLEKLLDRTKVLYEQYFMGIQKLAPMQLHRDIERRVRELMQQQIRNTSLRFRFTTISQKFGAYQTYWKRTLREIEQGKYVRELVRVKKKADALGQDLPEELLVKLPKLVQDRIRRDRARMAERALRDEGHRASDSSDTTELDDEALAELALTEIPDDEAPPVHTISEEEAQALFGEGDLDMDGLFSALTQQAAAGATAPAPQAAAPTRPAQAPAEPRAAEPASSTRPAQAPAEPRAAEPASSTRPTVTVPRGLPVGRPGARSEPSFRVPLPGGGGRPGPAPLTGELPVMDDVPETPRAPLPPPAPPPPAPPRPRRSETVPRVAPPPAPRVAPPPAPRVAPPPAPPAATLPPGMDERQCRELYARYLKARQLVGESNEDITYDRLVSSLRKQASAIMTQHGARGVQFHVVVKGEKVVLKAKPLKTGKPGE